MDCCRGGIKRCWDTSPTFLLLFLGTQIFRNPMADRPFCPMACIMGNRVGLTTWCTGIVPSLRLPMTNIIFCFGAYQRREPEVCFFFSDSWLSSVNNTSCCLAVTPAAACNLLSCAILVIEIRIFHCLGIQQGLCLISRTRWVMFSSSLVSELVSMPSSLSSTICIGYLCCVWLLRYTNRVVFDLRSETCLLHVVA